VTVSSLKLHRGRCQQRCLFTRQGFQKNGMRQNKLYRKHDDERIFLRVCSDFKNVPCGQLRAV
jgi:hypothetical protein